MTLFVSMLSTIIMPCNNTGFTDPQTTLGWGIVDFDWSNKKGTGTADGWFLLFVTSFKICSEYILCR